MGKSDNFQTTMVEAKYTPIKDHYRGTPLVVSVTGEGKRTKAVFEPGVWTKCSLACAMEAENQVKKAMRNSRMVPDGTNMEAYMGLPGAVEGESGVQYRERNEGGEPDYEFQIRGR